MNEQIAGIRHDYKMKSLLEKDLASDPFAQFTIWWDEAVHAQIDEVNAFTLCTVSADNHPHARIVLLKGYDENGFVFFTNYLSTKGKNIRDNNHVAMVFFWKELERQVRIEGIATKVSDAESDTYFFSRPKGSRIGAWSSPQSSRIESREVIEKNEAAYSAKFPMEVPRPPHWGGYRIMPVAIEFWQGRSNRLHDRFLFRSIENGQWKVARLAP